MRVAISGSRGPNRVRSVGWTDHQVVYDVVKRLLEAGHTIHVGDAPSGVDQMVQEAFDLSEFEKYPSSALKVYEARWGEEVKRAGHNRNQWMITESDMLVALFAPVVPLTAGTTDAVRRAIKKGIPVHTYFEPLGWGSIGLLEGRTKVKVVVRTASGSKYTLDTKAMTWSRENKYPVPYIAGSGTLLEFPDIYIGSPMWLKVEDEQAARGWTIVTTSDVTDFENMVED